MILTITCHKSPSQTPRNDDQLFRNWYNTQVPIYYSFHFCPTPSIINHHLFFFSSSLLPVSLSIDGSSSYPCLHPRLRPLCKLIVVYFLNNISSNHYPFSLIQPSNTALGANEERRATGELQTVGSGNDNTKGKRWGFYIFMSLFCSFFMSLAI